MVSTVVVTNTSHPLWVGVRLGQSDDVWPLTVDMWYGTMHGGDGSRLPVKGELPKRGLMVPPDVRRNHAIQSPCEARVFPDRVRAFA